MTNAYVETTILTNVLLKPGSKKQADAVSALKRYQTTLLPVYAIKEWKAGPLNHFVYLHDKLVTTKSLRDTLAAIASLSPYTPYKKSTSLEALAAAAQLDSQKSDTKREATTSDEEIADRYRLALASLIIRSWRRRRAITTRTIQDLECYTEIEPKIGKTGLFELGPRECEKDRECCLAEPLKTHPDSLRALRNAIPQSSKREEDRRRRKVLKQLINTPKEKLDRDQCLALGDAIFAFFCPEDGVVLTTNIKDHEPLAQAIGKKVEAP